MSTITRSGIHKSILEYIHIAYDLIRISIKEQLTYRTAMIAGLVTNFFWSLLRVYVIIALYQGADQVNSLTLQGAITYVGISQAFIAFLTVFGSYDLMMVVYTGDIASDLLKPVHLYFYWLNRDLGRSIVNFLVRALTGMLAFSLIFDVYLPKSLTQWLVAFLSLGFAWLISYTFRFIINLIAFWSPDARGYGRVAYTISQLFTGMFIPLRMFPDWFTKICQYSPFPSILNTPIEIYLGVLQGKELWSALSQQVLWYLLLVGISILVLRRGIERLVIQGG